MTRAASELTLRTTSSGYAMPETFHITLTGNALPGFSLDLAARGLASVMRIDQAQALKLLSAGETIVKRNVAADQVQRYIDAMARVGVEARAESAAALLAATGLPQADAYGPALNAAASNAPIKAPWAPGRAPDLSLAAPQTDVPPVVPVPFPRPIAGWAATGGDESEAARGPRAATPWGSSLPEDLAGCTPVGDAGSRAGAAPWLQSASLVEDSSAPQLAVAAVPAALALVGEDHPPSVETIDCPACGARQPKRNLCRECGADMPRILASREVQQKSGDDSVYAPPRAIVRDFIAEIGETPRCLGFSLRGRIGRLRYLAYSLPGYVVTFISVLMVGALNGRGGSPSVGAVAGVVIIGLLGVFLSIRVVILRLHDLNRSAWWILLALVAAVSLPFLRVGVLFIGGLYLVASLALVFWPGSRQSNDYGSPPGPNTLWTVLGALVTIGLSLTGTVASPPGKLGSGGFEATVGGERQRR